MYGRSDRKTEKSRLNQYRGIRSSKQLQIASVCAHRVFHKIENSSTTYPLLKNSIHPRVFCKKAILNKLLKLTKKCRLWSFFSVKFVSTGVLWNSFFEKKACNFAKNGHHLKYFPVNFTTFSRTQFLQNTPRLLSQICAFS